MAWKKAGPGRQGGSPMGQINVRLADADREELNLWAASEGKTVTHVVRRIVRRAIAERIERETTR